MIVRAHDWAGVSHEIKHLGVRDHAIEVYPTENASILGRVLVALGASRGREAEHAVSLPGYLDHVDDAHRLVFARTYLANRGQSFDLKDTITIREKRPVIYLDELARFLRDASGERVRRTGNNFDVSAAAVRAIDASM